MDLDHTPALELTAEERARYEEDGFFARRAVFGPADLERLRAAAERVAAKAKRAALAKSDAVDRAEASGNDDYSIDGTRYVDVTGAAWRPGGSARIAPRAAEDCCASGV